MVLPWGVRCTIYSFLEFRDLIKPISHLSHKERKLICNSLVLDQSRTLKLFMGGYNQYHVDGVSGWLYGIHKLFNSQYYLQLATKIQIRITDL